MLTVEQFLAKQSAEAGASSDPKPKFKKLTVIRPMSLVKKTYLEDSNDVEEFLSALRAELEAAIGNDERIEIR